MTVSIETMSSIAGVLIGAAIFLLYPAFLGDVLWGVAGLIFVCLVLWLPCLRTTRRLIERLPERDRSMRALLRVASTEPLRVRIAAAYSTTVGSLLVFFAYIGAVISFLYVLVKHWL